MRTPDTPGDTPGTTPKGKDELYIPPHAFKNKFFMCCFRICSSSLFNNFITFLIVANTVVLALDRYDLPQVEINVYIILN